MTWAQRLKRVFGIDIHTCAACGGAMRIIGCIEDPEIIRVHRPDGALFLWLWFPGLGISSQVLYARLKARGVLVLSGHHFFPGLAEDWAYRHECIRVTYSQDEASVREGIRIIGEEMRAARETLPGSKSDVRHMR